MYKLIPAGTRGGPAFDDPAHIPRELLDYQDWLHERLHTSGLAKGLAAGPDFLPDITAELPQCWRTIARLTAPRTYRRLTEQVLRNLEWYLGKGTPPVTPIHKLRKTLMPSLALTAFTLVSLGFATKL